MRHGRYSVAILTAVLLHGCGGNDSPTAPTGGGTPTPTPTPTPIVVTVTAQVVNAAALQGARTFGPDSFVEPRLVRVGGNVEVTGGSATIGGEVTFRFTPDGGQPPVDVTQDVFSPRQISGSFPFTADINLELPPGTSTAGDVVVNVTGTDGNGGNVNVSSETLPVTDSNTRKPPSNCLPDGTTACALDGRFKVTAGWGDFDGNTGPAMVTDGERYPDGAWLFFSGASSGTLSPEGFDLFVRLLDNCATDNSFWVFAAATTDVEFTLTVTDTQTNQTKTYFNPLGMPAEAITDTQAFATCP